MENDTDDFFDAFKQETVKKVKKFNFKRVEESQSKPSAPETVSRFFQNKVKCEKSRLSVEDQLESLFGENRVETSKKQPDVSRNDQISSTKSKFVFKNVPKRQSSEYFESKPPTQEVSPKKTVSPTKLESLSKFKFKKKTVSDISADFDALLGEKITPNEVRHEETSKNTTIDNKNILESTNSLNSNKSIDSPIVGLKKKFAFKKPPIADLNASSSPSSLLNRYEKLSLPNRNSIISISSTENSPIILHKKNTDCKKLLLTDKVTSLSQNLAASEDDYMDDETFEKLFGEHNQKNKNEVSDIDLGNINWDDEDFGDSKANNVSKSTEESYLAEVSSIDWSEEVFDEAPAISFKDRQDDTNGFQKHYHFSDTMDEVLHQKFGLQTFRPQQREIINAALNRHDCFVLMPTGGGKSLCYQLPAVLSEGVSVVISPLRALIGDQVDKMNELEIAAAHLCQDVGVQETGVIMSKLHCREPLIKLLYLTPEKIVASRAVGDVLKSLYQRGKLARFIIDEAHCLSQWGHDFRPDYKQMSFLKSEFKDVPIMCLTATATKEVENDVISILKLKNVKRFIMSFNRPNIKYQVIPKKGKLANEEIIGLIKKKFLKKSGIIYCLARNDCENLADAFNASGIKARPYHAGLSDKIRNAIQREWMQDRFFVIVATIAFGMGIDKPDVRFVIHNSIPKSVEAFYQESGRAGRDGDISYSFLFYNYSDVLRLQKIMKLEKKTSAKVMEGHHNNLKQMVSFAENVVDCRRYLQLIHLGENFDRQLCIKNKPTTCDNCENINTYDTIDVTKQARELGTLVQDLSNKSNVTMLHVADVYKGSKIQKILKMGHDKHKHYAAGSSMDRTDIQRILKDLVLRNILTDHATYNGDFPVVYIRPGKKFGALNAPNAKFTITVSKKSAKKSFTFADVDNDDAVDKRVIDDAIDSPGPSRPAPLPKAKKSTYSAFNKTKINNLKVECHEALLEECRRMALERNLTLSSIMNLTAIKNMSEILPKSREEFLKIQHVTEANYKKCGDNFLAITAKFRQQVEALETAPKITENDDDDWSTSLTQSSSGGGTKRKFSGGVKKWGNKKRKTYKKKKSPGKKRGGVKKSGWVGKKGGSGGGGGLGFMPVRKF